MSADEESASPVKTKEKVIPVRFTYKYEGRFYEKFKKSQSSSYLSGQSETSTRRIPWSENRRHLSSHNKGDDDSQEPPPAAALELGVVSEVKPGGQTKSVSDPKDNENETAREYLSVDEEAIQTEVETNERESKETREEEMNSFLTLKIEEDRDMEDDRKRPNKKDLQQRDVRTPPIVEQRETSLRDALPQSTHGGEVGRVVTRIRISTPKTYSFTEQIRISRGTLVHRSQSPKKVPKPWFEDDDVIWSIMTKDAEEYNMQHKRRGVAVIFNHEEFDRWGPRQGGRQEWKEMVQTLVVLGFEVRVHHDLTQKDLKTVLRQMAELDHSQTDCFLMVVLTALDHGCLCSKDGVYEERELWRRFTGDKCKSLVGKPKLFFIDACRYTPAVTPRMVVADVTDSVSMSYMIPVEADILTVKWLCPKRDPSQGSWFITALCQELSTNVESYDLLALLTFVNRRLANLCSQQTPSQRDEMPTITSMLTRLVYFRDKRKQ